MLSDNAKSHYEKILSVFHESVKNHFFETPIWRLHPVKTDLSYDARVYVRFLDFLLSEYETLDFYPYEFSGKYGLSEFGLDYYKTLYAFYLMCVEEGLPKYYTNPDYWVNCIVNRKPAE